MNCYTEIPWSNVVAIVVVRNLYSQKITVLPALYCNECPIWADDSEQFGNRWKYLPEPDHEDGNCLATGWFSVERSNDEYEQTYEAMMENGDELIAWCELPRFDDTRINE